MNGVRQPGPAKSARQLRAELAVTEACEPIQDAHQEAKAAYAAALASGDRAAIVAAKTGRDEAARRLNETRRWLRAEDRIVDLTRRLASDHWEPAIRIQMERELALMEQTVAPYREAFGSLPGPVPDVVVEPGSAKASLPTVHARKKGDR